VKLVSGGFWAEWTSRRISEARPSKGTASSATTRRPASTWAAGWMAWPQHGRVQRPLRRPVQAGRQHFRGPGLDGRATDYKEVMEMVDADHRSMEMSCKDKKGKFVKMMPSPIQSGSRPGPQTAPA